MKLSAPATPSIRPQRDGHLVISSNPTDINECLTLGLCKDSDCVNTRGSYLCTCRPGLMLDPSRSRCVCECCQGLGVGVLGGRMGPPRSTGQPGPKQKSPPGPIPGPYLLLNLKLGPTYKNRSPPCRLEWRQLRLLALGISFGALQFEVFHFCFLLNHFCCLIYFTGMCVASALMSD